MREFEKNSRFYFEGCAKNDFMLIRKGSMALNYYEINGKSKYQMICCENTLVNEANILSHMVRDKIEYECLSKVEGLYFPAGIFDRAFLEANPALLFNMAYSQSVKLIHVIILYNAMSVRTKLQLVCWFLLWQSISHGNASSFVPDVTQAQMSMLLGINYRSLSRNVTYLKDEGIIACFTRRNLTITDRKRLEQLSLPSS